MKLDLNYEGFEENLIEKTYCLGGVQYIFKFNNKHGASIIKKMGSYGHENDLWELAVIYYPYIEENIWELDYSTCITPDVIGYLKDSQVRELLQKIKDL